METNIPAKVPANWVPNGPWVELTCEYCHLTVKVSVDERKMIEWKCCYDCMRTVWTKKNRKQCRICGDHALPLDSAEDTCDECKEDLKPGNKRTVPTIKVPTANQIVLGQRKTTDGDEYSLVGR